MKKPIVNIVLLLSTIMFNPMLFAAGPGHSHPIFRYACEGAILEGCVGECGASYHAEHVVTKEDVARSRFGIAVFCLKPVSNSLCPNTGAFFELQRNGQTIFHGDLADGDKGLVAGEVGDVVSVAVKLAPKDSDINCIRLGETEFKLGHFRIAY